MYVYTFEALPPMLAFYHVAPTSSNLYLTSKEKKRGRKGASKERKEKEKVIFNRNFAPLHTNQHTWKRWLFLRPYQLNDGEELLVSLVSLLFLQNQHEVVVETALHHHPVDGPGQVNVCRQEHNVFSAKCCNGLVSGE